MMATSLPYRISGVGIPAPDTEADNIKSLLLVFLADFEEKHEEKLIKHLQPPHANYKLQGWRPSKVVLQSLAPQVDGSDSLSTLYGLAIVAYRAGHSGFLVADEATKRRVEGQIPLRGEDDNISVAMVSVRAKDGQLRVIAKRSTMCANGDNDESFDLGKAIDSFDVTHDFNDGETEDGVPRIYEDFGFEILDPDSPPFTPGTADSFGYERIYTADLDALSENTPLPLELVLEVISRAERGLTEPTQLPPNLDYNSFKPVINILLSFKTTEIERENLRSRLQDAVHVEYEKLATERKDKKPGDSEGDTQENDEDENEDGHSENEDEGDEYEKYSIHDDASLLEPIVHLIPWGATQPTRRDISNLRRALDDKSYSEIPDRQKKVPYILLGPVKEEDVLNSKLLSTCDSEMGLGVFEVSLGGIVQQRQKHEERWEVLQSFRAGQLELLPSPNNLSGFDKPFFPSPYPGNPIGRCMNSIGLFFLTNKLSKDQVEAIYREVTTGMDGEEDDGFGEKIICPVPWKEGEEEAEDGTPADMWRLYREVEGKGDNWPLLFVDQRSGEDLKVILSEAMYVYTGEAKDAEELLKTVECPHYRGINYGRHRGRMAHTSWANLNIANMSFDELMEELVEEEYETWLRPDWPFHDRLVEGDWPGCYGDGDNGDGDNGDGDNGDGDNGDEEDEDEE